MKRKWTERYNRLAYTEGWNLFNHDGVLMIMRVDDPPAWEYWREGDPTKPRFSSDEAALAFVRRRKFPHARCALAHHGKSQ